MVPHNTSSSADCARTKPGSIFYRQTLEDGLAIEVIIAQMLLLLILEVRKLRNCSRLHFQCVSDTGFEPRKFDSLC
jgi:hypothetical protein